MDLATKPGPIAELLRCSFLIRSRWRLLTPPPPPPELEVAVVLWLPFDLSDSATSSKVTERDTPLWW